MKATHTKTPATFTPVTINITCETQEELSALYHLFNHAGIDGAIRKTYNMDKSFMDVVNAEIEKAWPTIYERKMFVKLEKEIIHRLG